jgi:intein/homing endonuclease
LPADTLITCIDGEKKIKDVCVGDYVLTRQGYKKVLWAGITKRNAKTSVLYAGGNKLIATPDHRVYSIERGWVQMESLQKGEHVLCLQKLLKVPTAVQCVKGGAIEPEVYDLTVEEQHEFFANGVLVHNCIDALRYAYSNEIQNKNSSWAGLIS